jgi:sugar-phosphatase
VFEDAEAGLLAAAASGGRVVVVGGHTSATTAGLERLRDYTGAVPGIESASLPS